MLALALALQTLQVAGPPRVDTYDAQVVSIYDGDTFKVSIPSWPDPFKVIDVRVSGIDTPEHIKPPAKKLCEVKLGVKAIVTAKTLIHPGDQVQLTWNSVIGNDKYFRLLASVTLPDGRNYGDTMIALGAARSYNGGTKTPWC